MTNIIHAAMTFAMLPVGRIVHIDDVLNGARCGCICPQCKQALIAKNGGQERAHHFAHEGGAQCEGGTETALHLAAKQIIADHKKIALPIRLKEANREYPRFIDFNSVQLEHTLRNPSTQQRIIVDCYGTSSEGPYIVEIAVHHKVESEKVALIDSLEISAIEITLSDLIGTVIGWNELRDAVLSEKFRRNWISARQLEQSLPIIEPETTSRQVSKVSSLGEWCFAIGQTWIWVREFQSGDLRVFHRYDQRVREIIEPMCRRRGYWNARYKNWIVFKQFKAELLETLAREGQVVHAPSL